MMKAQQHFLFLTIIATVFVFSCKPDDSPPPPPPVAADAITNLQIADIADNGNGLDLQVAFAAAADENKIQTYRVFVLKTSAVANFTLDIAEQQVAERYTTVAKQGGAIQQVMPAEGKDTDGDLIMDDVAYTVFVLSVADGTIATINTLSTASNEATLTSPANPVASSPAGKPAGTDIDNYGDGRDLEVQFQAATDESLVDHYRMIVVPATSASIFTLNDANVLPQDQYVIVDKTGSDLTATFARTTKDSEGDAIAEDSDYQIFVLSVADGTIATINALSEASDIVSLIRFTTTEVTYISNDGVMISDEDHVVLIDALHRMDASSGWITPPLSAINKIESADAPYDAVDLILVTHNHGDHYSISSINNHLANNPNARLIAPPQVLANFVGSSQTISISPARGRKASTTVNGIKVTVLHMAHFIPPNSGGWPNMENYAYIVEVGGKRFLHLGDNAMTTANLKNLKIAEEEQIDVVMLPAIFSSVHLSASAGDAMKTHIAPKHIIALHLFQSAIATVSNNIRAIYPDAKIFTAPFEKAKY